MCYRDTGLQGLLTLASTYSDKKVLLRECKRHTTRRVASARCTALSYGGRGGGVLPHPVLPGRYPIQSWPGWGTQSSPGWGGTPSGHGQGVPHPVMDGVTPSSPGGGGVPHPVLMGVPGIGYPPVQTWDGASPSQEGWGTPLVS